MYHIELDWNEVKDMVPGESQVVEKHCLFTEEEYNNEENLYNNQSQRGCDITITYTDEEEIEVLAIKAEDGEDIDLAEVEVHFLD